MFISQPHFLNADPYYLSLVQSGLSPDPMLHGTSFKVEPLSGIPTDVIARWVLSDLLKGRFFLISGEMYIPGQDSLVHMTLILSL